MPKIIKIITLISFLVFALFFIVSIFGISRPVYADYQCNNGPSNSDSNGCGDACYYGNAWSKYWKYTCVAGWCFNYLGPVCSTGDKCVPGETGLRPGYCDCGSSGSIYKTCCRGSTAVACNRYYQQDNYPPPEGTCAPNTYVYGSACTSSPPPPGPTSPPGVPTNPPGIPTTPPGVPTNPPGIPTTPPGVPTNPPSGPSCGQLGGNACTNQTTPPCTNLGNTYDCTPCWFCGGSAPTSPPPPVGCVCEWRDYGCAGSSHGTTCPAGYRKWSYECNRGGCGDTQECRLDPSCNPTTCTLSLSPSSLTFKAGESQLITANVSVWNVLRVVFSSGNTNIAQVNPLSVSSAPYTTTVYGTMAGTTSISAVANLNPSGSCTASIPVSIEASAWFQTQGGDIHAQGNLSDNIPSTALDPNLSLDLNNYSGVITHQSDGGADLGEGYPSHNEPGRWLAESSYEGKPYGSFDFFKKKYAMKMTQDNFNGAVPAEDGVYYSADSETFNSDQGDWDLGGNRWLVILVEGDVNIPFNVVVGQGSFLAIASSGNITFGNNVRKAQGMFVANGTINTGSSNRAFEGQGIFAANTFDLNRDFADSRNRTTPAETFKARPDFIMSSYKNKDENLWWFFQKWQEVAP